VEVRKLPHVVYLAVFLGTAQLTALSKQAVFDFTATAVHRLGAVM
jgi:hypothetical protein